MADKRPNRPPTKKESFSVDEVAAAIEASRGNIAGAARALKCRPNTVRDYCRRHPEIQSARAEGEELRLDIAESALDKAVEAGEAWAVCFFLKTRGKARGYTERHEVTGSDDGPVRFTIKLGD